MCGKPSPADGAERPLAGRSPRFDILLSDLHGILRGLSAPLAEREALVREGVHWSSSLLSSRFDGGVTEETGRGIQCGDPDFPCRYLADTLAPVPWREGDEQAMFAMFRPDGAPYSLDPLHALDAVLGRFEESGWDAVLATEFEFYLQNEDGSPCGGSGVTDLYSMDEIDRQEPFLRLLTRACEGQGLPVGNIVSEYGSGQWEVNLNHRDARRACLDGLLLRHAVRCCAARCGKRASFIAKPYAGMSGSGMHIHVSVWRAGENCLADGARMGNAVAGALALSREATLFYAPFDNSYRRFLPDSYAPIVPNWARENRAAMIRLPAAKNDAAVRLEFRLAGADVNPLLATAALLAGIHFGLSGELSPPPENQRHADLALPMTWHEAIESLSAARELPRYFDGDFLDNYVQVKKDEWRRHRQYISDYDRLFYGRVL